MQNYLITLVASFLPFRLHQICKIDHTWQGNYRVRDIVISLFGFEGQLTVVILLIHLIINIINNENYIK
jgi:hypothetical protein